MTVVPGSELIPSMNSDQILMMCSLFPLCYCNHLFSRLGDHDADEYGN